MRSNEVLAKKSVEQKREVIRSFKARVNANRSAFDRLADWFTLSFGTVGFLIFNIVVFAVWIPWNLGLIAFLPIIDPYPFGLLTTGVSLEAIFLAIIVLVSQNREGHIAELREEMELYIDTYAETEITKLLYLVTLLLEKQGIDMSEDGDIQKMLCQLQPETIQEQLEQDLKA